MLGFSLGLSSSVLKKKQEHLKKLKIRPSPSLRRELAKFYDRVTITMPSFVNTIVNTDEHQTVAYTISTVPKQRSAF